MLVSVESLPCLWWYIFRRNKYQYCLSCVRVITSGDPAISDHALSVIFVMSRATSRRIHTARHSPLVLADNFLRGVGRHILTARRYVPVISDDLMLAAAASFARQPPRAGPSADLLAAALATPLPRTRSPLPVVAAGFPHQLPHAGPPANLLAAVLSPPPPCPRPLFSAAAPSFACQSPPAGPPATLLVEPTY